MYKVVSASIIILIFVLLPNAQSQNIEIMSYNIGSSNWTGNRDRVVSIIKEHNPDVLAAIEATGNTRPYLESNLNDYQLLPSFENPNNTESHIFYKRNLFVVISSGFVEIETYGGYTGPDRYINWAHLKENSSGYQFIIYASHMVFIQPNAVDSATIAQYRHAITMVQLMTEHSSLEVPLITVGDFNATRSSGVIQFLIEQTPINYGNATYTNPLSLDDSWDIANPNTTKPGTVGNSSNGMAIDWIIVSTGLEVSKAIIDTNSSGASDHLPLVINIGDDAITSLHKSRYRTYNVIAYPNPFHSIVTFDFASIYYENVSLDILSVSGKVVYHLDNDKLFHYKGPIELDLSRLAPNVYYYHLVAPNHTLTGSLIKSN